MGQDQVKHRLITQLEALIRKRIASKDAPAVMELARQIYADFPENELFDRELSDLAGASIASWSFIQQLQPGRAKIRVFNPDFQQHGWQLNHTVVCILCADMPFITDSVRGELNRRNIAIHTIHGTVLRVVRDGDRLKQLLASGVAPSSRQKKAVIEEALIYFEINRRTDPQELAEITATLEEILDEVAYVVRDFHPMVAQGRAVLEELDSYRGQIGDAQISEVQALIQWMCDGYFTFLGYECLAVDSSAKALNLTKVKDSELGLLRYRGSFSQVDLHRELTAAPAPGQLLDQMLVFSKSSVRSRVHRLVYPDYVSIKRFDGAGRVVGEHRFMGLYTSSIYTLSPRLIPLIRNKVAEVIARSGFDPDSHKGKDLAHLLDVYPRDELFQASVDELFDTAMQINHIQERRQVRLFVRRDRFGKFVNCLVYTPKDIYRTDLRVKTEMLLCDAFGAQESEFTTFFSESVLTRTYYVLRVDPNQSLEVDLHALEQEIVQVTMSWEDHLRTHLLEEFGEERGTALADMFGGAFPPGYMDDFDPRAGVVDIKKIASLDTDTAIAMDFYRAHGEADNEARFRLLHRETQLVLSEVMPILEHLGLRVLSERPYGIDCRDGSRVWVHEFSLSYAGAVVFDIKQVGDKFKEAFCCVWFGDAESDAFNKLILGAGLGWRQVALLRAYARYMRQIQFNFSEAYIAETLFNHLDIAAQLVELFHSRFALDVGDEHTRLVEKARLEESLLKALDAVENLSEDRIIRQYLHLINATVRTNYFQRDAQGALKNYFSFKLRSELIPDMPLPLPMFEIFVYSPWMEGVHLRGGKVARGGLRWSDRQEDFRTEILGLVKAQQVKNAVIVPTGAKGGFVVKQMPPSDDREKVLAEGIRCYQTLIRGMLDITDNYCDGEVVAPPQVVRKDDDDIYLVVAADKGTASFSDIANAVSQEYGFWLGDAFASGGSAGYDHKKMGITARGAWVSVQRHFREMDINIQQRDFSVIGIGDMSGDVFGNGMLLSPHICLVAAFNHQHIFIDPNPDAGASFTERQRLFALPRSGWNDYDAALISKGGGIFSRAAKSIAVSPQMKKRFDIGADKLTPNELIAVLLRAPVDLLWNGGIGTYIKSSQETHASVGDKTNDVLRVNACDLRAKVVGEGGNLGMTQLARVEYALKGGRCNTDFIDNVGGVDCSDHEVNIKILLNTLVRAGDMTLKQRNALLEEMTDAVAQLVLNNSYGQTLAISLAEREALRRTGEYRRFISGLENHGRLSRSLEFIPDDEILVERRAAGKALTRPELSVLISYAKSHLKDVLVSSAIGDDPYLARAVETAFPQRLRDKFAAMLHSHQLRREIIATQIANDMVNNMGITFVDRMTQSTGAEPAVIACAYVTARDVYDLPAYWGQIQALDYQVSSAVQQEMMANLMRLVRRASRWLLRNRRSALSPQTEVERFAGQIRQLSERLPTMVVGSLSEDREQRYQKFVAAGVPDALAAYVSSASLLYSALGIVEAAGAIKAPVDKFAELYFALQHELELDWFARQIADLTIENYWQAMARESFRDDLEWQLRSLTMGAMRHICQQGDVGACLTRWLDDKQHLVRRWRSMLAELQSVARQDFAMLSVAIRELLDMAQSSRYSDVAADGSARKEG